MVYNVTYQPSDFPLLLQDLFGTALSQIILYVGIIIVAVVIILIIRALRK